VAGQAGPPVPRIAVVTSSPPFSEGGHVVIARALVRALQDAGHEATIITTPQNRFGRQAAAYLATWLTDVGAADEGRPIHQVISLRYPSYAVRHAQHVCWLNHTMREYYDQWPQFSSRLSGRGRIKERVRQQIIHRADRRLLGRVRRLFAQSRTIADRLKRYVGLDSEVLPPPPPQRPYRTDEYGDYLFAVSRLHALKRMDLLIEALSEPEARGIRCVIAGEGVERRSLESLISTRGLSSRVALAGRITDDELVTHLARCRAVCFPPYDEDYGFVTVEAFASAKPVITCTDSGGAAEFVTDGVSGLISEPSPSSLAVAIRRLMDDRALAERLGRQGFERASVLSWSDTVKRLVVV
jgi:glycosyltransferase involved in cell wall biosynthesis